MAPFDGDDESVEFGGSGSDGFRGFWGRGLFWSFMDWIENLKKNQFKTGTFLGSTCNLWKFYNFELKNVYNVLKKLIFISIKY